MSVIFLHNLENGVTFIVIAQVHTKNTMLLFYEANICITRDVENANENVLLVWCYGHRQHEEGV